MKTKLLQTDVTPKISLIHNLKIAPAEVVLFKADVNYTEVVLITGERIVISKTLKELEGRLQTQTPFFRTHKSYIVNLAHILSFQLNEGMTIQLANNETAVISRRRKGDFLLNVRGFGRK